MSYRQQVWQRRFFEDIAFLRRCGLIQFVKPILSTDNVICCGKYRLEAEKYRREVGRGIISAVRNEDRAQSF
jgi:hypothetical protein